MQAIAHRGLSKNDVIWPVGKPKCEGGGVLACQQAKSYVTILIQSLKEGDDQRRLGAGLAI